MSFLSPFREFVEAAAPFEGNLWFFRSTRQMNVQTHQQGNLVFLRVSLLKKLHSCPCLSTVVRTSPRPPAFMCSSLQWAEWGKSGAGLTFFPSYGRSNVHACLFYLLIWNHGKQFLNLKSKIVHVSQHILDGPENLRYDVDDGSPCAHGNFWSGQTFVVVLSNSTSLHGHGVHVIMLWYPNFRTFPPCKWFQSPSWTIKPADHLTFRDA